VDLLESYYLSNRLDRLIVIIFFSSNDNEVFTILFGRRQRNLF
jgi:hypothetical protein